MQLGRPRNRFSRPGAVDALRQDRVFEVARFAVPRRIQPGAGLGNTGHRARRMQAAELEYLASSAAASRALAENYVGLSFD